MIFIGIDYGDKRTGVALSDAGGTFAYPFKTLTSSSMKNVADMLAEIIISENVDIIVMGLPLNMDSSEGIRASKTRSLGKVLTKITSKDVIFMDERLTTYQADELLSEAGLSKKQKLEGLLDQMAAKIILQSYLDSRQKE